MRTPRLVVTLATLYVGCGSKDEPQTPQAPAPVVAPLSDAQALAPDAAGPTAAADPTATHVKVARMVTAQPWMGTTFGNGLVVAAVRPDSPATKAGLRLKDEVVSVDGTPVKDRTDVAKLMFKKEIGDTIALRIKRDKKPLALRVELAVNPAVITRLRNHIGKPAPSIGSLETAPGKSLAVDMKGKVVVLAFASGTCAPCTALLPLLAKFQAKYATKGLVVIAVTNEPPDKLAAKGLTIGQDVGPIIRSFSVIAMPTLVLIDRSGTIRDAIIPTRKQFSTLEHMVESLLANKPADHAKPHHG